MYQQHFDIETKKVQIDAAAGKRKAQLVIKNVHFLNVFTTEFEQADIAVDHGCFVGIGSYEGETEIDGSKRYMVPGFIDGHMHLESSSVLPAEYAKAVIPHGTTTVVADPHEIANVCGADGIKFMLDATQGLPLDVFFMLPSCVPASPFDENGAEFTKEDISRFLQHPRVLGLAEVMNYPGVLSGDQKLLEKMKLTTETGGYMDGHAPGLTGKALNAYNTAGIYTDHECSTIEEAKEKMRNGEWIMVREGTASRNLNALMEMFDQKYYRHALLVTDDKHPGDLIADGHIDHIIRRAVACGAKPENAYAMASYHAAQCFDLRNRGAICPGYLADFVLLDDVDTVQIAAVYKEGICVTDEAMVSQSAVAELDVQAVHDTMHINSLTASDFALNGKRAKVIGLVPGDLITTDEGWAHETDTTQDIVKLSVVERHKATGHIGIGFLKGYGLKEGAIATTVAHDSHNLIIAGTNDEDMALAAMHLKEIGGGMTIVKDGKVLGDLAFPIAGLMSELPAQETQSKMDYLKEIARTLGIREGVDPFMSLSFTSLPVIPSLKLTSLGMVDVEKFCLITHEE